MSRRIVPGDIVRIDFASSTYVGPLITISAKGVTVHVPGGEATVPWDVIENLDRVDADAAASLTCRGYH